MTGQSGISRHYKVLTFLAVLTGELAMAPSNRAALQSRIPTEINPAQLVAMGGNVHPMARAEFDRGRLDGSQRIQDVMLMFGPSPEQQAALNQLLQAQQDRNSPLYHQWL